MESTVISRVVLGYWDVRGRGEPIRLLLNYLNIPYTDRVFPLSDRCEWEQYKTQSADIFVNLPFLEVYDSKNQIQTTEFESDSISQYICTHFSNGNHLLHDPIQRSKMCGVVEDVKLWLSRYAYHSDKKEAEEVFLVRRLQPLLNKLNTHLSKNNFLLSDGLSYVDFTLYESLKTLQKINREKLLLLNNLTQFISRVEALPAIASYLTSNRFHADYLFYGDPSDI